MTPATSMLHMDKDYHFTARQLFPVLVRQAYLGETITYSDLAREINFHAQPRNLNYPLGSVGFGMADLSEALNLDIPKINLLVVGKASERPGTGAGGQYETREFLKLPKWRQKELMRQDYQEIFDFEHWDTVLNALDLEPSKPNFSTEVAAAQASGDRKEGKEHIAIKEFIQNNPHTIGLLHNSKVGEIEYPLSSGDRVDVFFSRRNIDIAVEVKPSNAPHGDLIRGIFQCIKYKAVIEAMQCAEDKVINARAILVTTATLSPRLIALKNTLGVEVIDRFTYR